MTQSSEEYVDEVLNDGPQFAHSQGNLDGAQDDLMVEVDDDE